MRGVLNFNTPQQRVYLSYCPHMVDLSDRFVEYCEEARMWVYERFGPSIHQGYDGTGHARYNAKAKWGYASGVFYFACSVDAFEFKLRWG